MPRPRSRTQSTGAVRLVKSGMRIIARFHGRCGLSSFLWTPFFGEAISRVTVAADQTPKLVTKFRKSSNDKNIVSDSRFLADAELQKFQALLNDAGFWSCLIAQESC